MTRPLVVKITAGAEALERCAQGLTVATVALSVGAEVSVWLTGEAAWLAVPGRAEALTLEHSPPLADLRDAILEGAQLTVCTQCAARRGLSQPDLLPGARLAGSATFVEEILAPDAQALVY